MDQLDPSEMVTPTPSAMKIGPTLDALCPDGTVKSVVTVVGLRRIGLSGLIMVAAVMRNSAFVPVAHVAAVVPS